LSSKKTKEPKLPPDKPEGGAEGEPETESGAEAPSPDDLLKLLDAEREKYLRLYAEYENFRRRSQKEREETCSRASADVIAKLLPVYDNLSRALETPCSDEAFLRGVELTAAQLDEILKSLGVEAIPAAGEKFDPERHNAVSSVAADGAPGGTVTAEFRKGFTLNGKVIRHAVVQVSS
jgi:molecular chaperone GrpE